MMNKNSSFYQILYERRKAMGVANRKKNAETEMPAWLYPYSVENKYARDIKTIMGMFVELTNELFTTEQLQAWIDEYKNDSAEDLSIHGIDFKSDGFIESFSLAIAQLKVLRKKTFEDNSEPVRTLISSASINTNLFNSKQWGKQLKKILGMDIITQEPWENTVINAWSQNNLELINNLSEEYIKKINNIVSDGVQFGKTTGEIRRELVKQGTNIKGYRATLIARDQVGKLNGQFTQRRMEDVGIDLYTWLTSGDERVRLDHKKMGNKICKWNNSNVYSINGKTFTSRPSSMQGAIPGSQIQCRCTAVPYMGGIYAEIDKELEAAA